MKPNFSASFFKANAWFFYCFALFLLIGGILLATSIQGDFIFYFSDHRSYAGDSFFYYFTKVGEEPAYILVMLVLLFVAYRYVLWVPLIGIIVTAVAYAMKSFFAHPRPMAYFQELDLFEQINLVEGIVVRGGPTSFPSGHTMSAFALYAFVSFCIAQKKGAAIVLFLIALLVGISRIYLVQHFLKDIYLGAIVGVLLAIIIYWMQDQLLSHDSGKWWNKHLSFKR